MGLLKHPLFGHFKTWKTWKLVFWITFGLLILFSVTPRGYAQDLTGTSTPEVGTSSTNIGSSTTVQEEQPSTPPPPTAPASEPPPSQPTPAPPPPPAPQSFPYKKKFIISSYYSPLPNQKYYFKGSYERDIRLNGRGTNGADGTQVYPGMIAAPPQYAFGTKIEIPGLGILAVHDRGGAIKNSRLDVWMGKGEEGLSRALGWGVRTVEATVYGIDPNIQESISFDGVPLADISRILVQTKHFQSDLAEEDEGEEVRELQRFLKKLGYFDRDSTGYFGEETRAAVQKFQLQEHVIDSSDDPGAGNFGPKSRVTLESLLNAKRAEALAKIPSPPLKSGESGEAVKNLQEVLMEYGFLSSANGIFDEKTEDALVRFQIDIDAIKTKADFGAGFYGPKTQSSLQKFVNAAYTPFTSLGVQRGAPSPPKKIFSKELALNASGPDVILLQEELRRLKFFGLEPTGNFGKITEHAVFKFQQAFGIIAEVSDQGAGIVGPQTLEKLNEIALSRSSSQKLVAKTTEQKIIVAQRIENEQKLFEARLLAFSKDLPYGMRSSEVSRLQGILKRLGFFPGKLTTNYFGDITKQSVLAFQKSHGLTESGMVDESTRRVINTILTGPRRSS